MKLKMLWITSYGNMLEDFFSFQLHISGRNEIEVLVNGNLMEFDEQLMMDFNGVIILKYNNSFRYSIIFESGISVTVEEVEGILQMMSLIPPEFKGEFAISLLSMFSFSYIILAQGTQTLYIKKNKSTVIYLCFCVFLSRFRRDLNGAKAVYIAEYYLVCRLCNYDAPITSQVSIDVVNYFNSSRANSRAVVMKPENLSPPMRVNS